MITVKEKVQKHAGPGLDLSYHRSVYAVSPKGCVVLFGTSVTKR